MEYTLLSGLMVRGTSPAHAAFRTNPIFGPLGTVPPSPSVVLKRGVSRQRSKKSEPEVEENGTHHHHHHHERKSVSERGGDSATSVQKPGAESHNFTGSEAPPPLAEARSAPASLHAESDAAGAAQEQPKAAGDTPSESETQSVCGQGCSGRVCLFLFPQSPVVLWCLPRSRLCVGTRNTRNVQRGRDLHAASSVFPASAD